MKKREAVRKWMETITNEQARRALEIAIVRLIETEDLNILTGDTEDIERGPYWESCGEGILDEIQ